MVMVNYGAYSKLPYFPMKQNAGCMCFSSLREVACTCVVFMFGFHCHWLRAEGCKKRLKRLTKQRADVEEVSGLGS